MFKFILKNKLIPDSLHSSIHLSALSRLKEISATKDGNTLVIEGHIVPSPREPFLLKTHDTERCKGCPICKLPIDIKHTDVLILCQFIRSDGCMLPRRITGLCGMQQKRMSSMVSMAHKAGLLSMFNPPKSKRDPSRRKEHRKFNTYFDESTIKSWR